MGSPGTGPPYGGPPPGESPYGGHTPPYGYGADDPPYGRRAAPLGGRVRRLVAGVIDLVIVGVLTSPFSVTALERGPGGDLTAVHTGNGFLLGLVWFLYYWLLTAFWRGQTVGKKLMRLRVVQDPTQEPVTAGQAAVREALYGIFSVVCCLGLLDVLWILFDGKKQALHDKAASTIVVDA
ncbi:RDD family protein [Sphaerisporangium album]|uniref:RDD family protein n=1 Tax=Sphaerisporangium album TaxID=509200 RepID=UPI000DEA3E38|nr:RDD family protein [Sphaerisporangium album]